MRTYRLPSYPYGSAPGLPLRLLVFAVIAACGDTPPAGDTDSTSGQATETTTETATASTSGGVTPTTTAATTGLDTSSTTDSATSTTSTSTTEPVTSTTSTSTTEPGTSTTSTSTTEPGASTTSTSTTEPGTSTTDSETGVDPCGPDGEGPLLNCYEGCPAELFAVMPYVEEFAEQAGYDAHWTGNWDAPVLADGALTFGPHPLTLDWWDNYSPTTSKEKYGDTLQCARVRITPPATAIEDDDLFEITVRLPEGAMYETSGMTLTLDTANEQVLLRSRIGQVEWVDYTDAPLAFDRDVENTIDALVYGQGDKYVVEVRNAAYPDDVVVVTAEATLGATGETTLLGWRDSKTVYVDRLVIGEPSAAVYDRLVAELP
ncbi:hypothetical protein [Nannocystis pusilla]|uniref:Uncharacterized protein n=1 Tax=Nannocystis pusilla TaxID=889268 RepID=A0ABS7TZI2_9BACT|nr:hypothetical protein [Nannocystis pusilla]MBZ5713507.1 hypothetical protein [Nannocystis pusilla]